MQMLELKEDGKHPEVVRLVMAHILSHHGLPLPPPPKFFTELMSLTLAIILNLNLPYIVCYSSLSMLHSSLSIELLAFFTAILCPFLILYHHNSLVDEDLDNIMVDPEGAE